MPQACAAVGFFRMSAQKPADAVASPPVPTSGYVVVDPEVTVFVRNRYGVFAAGSPTFSWLTMLQLAGAAVSMIQYCAPAGTLTEQSPLSAVVHVPTSVAGVVSGVEAVPPLWTSKTASLRGPTCWAEVRMPPLLMVIVPGATNVCVKVQRRGAGCWHVVGEAGEHRRVEATSGVFARVSFSVHE